MNNDSVIHITREDRMISEAIGGRDSIFRQLSGNPELLRVAVHAGLISAAAISADAIERAIAVSQYYYKIGK